MIILHPYLPGCREDEQAPTWRFLDSLPRYLPVHHIDLSWEPLYGYGATLRGLWDGDRDWLIVEHDVEGTLDDVEAMRTCPELACTAPYGHSGHPTSQPKGQLMATSLGFTRITARARRLVGDWPVPAGRTYHILDSYLTTAITSALVTRTGAAWHVHRPVKHHHATSPRDAAKVELLA